MPTSGSTATRSCRAIVLCSEGEPPRWRELGRARQPRRRAPLAAPGRRAAVREACDAGGGCGAGRRRRRRPRARAVRRLPGRLAGLALQRQLAQAGLPPRLRPQRDAAGPRWAADARWSSCHVPPPGEEALAGAARSPRRRGHLRQEAGALAGELALSAPLRSLDPLHAAGGASRARGGSSQAGGRREDRLRATGDFREGVTASIERRPPRFRDAEAAAACANCGDRPLCGASAICEERVSVAAPARRGPSTGSGWHVRSRELAGCAVLGGGLQGRLARAARSARRQGRERRRDDARARRRARPGGLHDHDRGVRRLHARGRRFPTGLRSRSQAALERLEALAGRTPRRRRATRCSSRSARARASRCRGCSTRC